MLIIFITILLITSIVYAAGGGGRKVTVVEKTTSCEDKQTVKERVKCRLETGAESGTIEACKGLNNECVTLHKRAYSCYDKKGVDEDRCLKEKSRFTYKSVKKEASVNSINVRGYLVLLFYDLQQRVEEAYDNKRITAEDASELVSRIVEIKQDILTNKPKSIVKPAIDSFKLKWKEKMK